MALTAERGSAPDRRLLTVMYHYVRDVAGTPYPGLKAMAVRDFREQAARLQESFEMATLESALDFLQGRYRPPRDLCLLTFDDALAEHASTVAPILEERRIQGVFLIPTACVEEGVVLSAHKMHFLMAHLGFAEHRRRFFAELKELFPDDGPTADSKAACRTYRWDKPEVALFKYAVNYALPVHVRDAVLDRVFHGALGDERAFARTIYLSWDQARNMQTSGMAIGGHTHRHPALARLPRSRQEEELSTCLRLLRERLTTQRQWPFAYPFGKPDTFDNHSADLLSSLGFACAFTTVASVCAIGDDRFAIPRLDPKDL